MLQDARELPRWWPSVYLEVRVLDDGDVRGVGRVVDLWTKGWLPYTLRWRFTTTRNDGPGGISLRADGDFVGEGTWTFIPDGDHVKAFYDWRIRAEKPLLRRLTWLMRAAFSANHRWAMRMGEESMRLRARAPPFARGGSRHPWTASRTDLRAPVPLTQAHWLTHRDACIDTW